MPTRFISPPLEELNDLPTPLTTGERLFLDFLNENLSKDWEIYIQPHLNGLRPDFVLLSPAKGIAVFEVKDWDLDAVRYSYRDDPPNLHGERNGAVFSLAHQDPILKVQTYKREIYDLYCPSLPTRLGLGAITAGVVFPTAESTRLHELFDETHGGHLALKQHPLIGRDQLTQGNMADVFPLHDRTNAPMSDEVANELRAWLIEPDFAHEQREPLELDTRKKELVKTRTESGFRRIKGVAGSGKSLVLAARAAELAKDGRQVLVASYNITLLAYLRDLAVRWRRSRNLNKCVTWLHFHSWCKRIAGEAGEIEQYRALWKRADEEVRDQILDRDMAMMVIDLYDQYGDDLPKYDAILVDEGQDYRLEWWNALRKARKQNGEMLLVADPTQDVYATARAWTEQAMVGAGFPGGQWVTLNTSYRMPPQLVPLVRDFGERFLPGDELRALPEPKQTEIPFGQVRLRWIQTDEDSAIDACFREIRSMPQCIDNEIIPWADITFLAMNKKSGRQVVEQLEDQKIHVLHTFADDDRESRRQKIAFFKGAANVKATTPHSFKGWEGRAIVVYLPPLGSAKVKAGAYAALTRLKHHEKACALAVVCSWPEAEAYGRTWPEFQFFNKSSNSK